MKLVKRIALLSFLIAVCLCYLPVSSYADDGSCGLDATWHFEDGTLTISGTGKFLGRPWYIYEDSITAIIIEPGITNVPDNAFSDFKCLKDVSLPEGLISIGAYAFADCINLTNINLPDSLQTIGERAFRRTALTGITIPDGVSRIETNTFFQCERLVSITLSPYTTFIGKFAFEGCKNLSEIHLPDTLETIERNAFASCVALTSITIPDRVTDIAPSVFYRCEKLSHVTLSPYTRSINDGAFVGCKNLNSITIPASVEMIAGLDSDIGHIHISDILAWCNIDFDSKIYNVLSNARLYHNGELITDLVIPEGCEHISQYAFAEYQHLRSVTFPDGMKTVGEGAFLGCTNLTSIVLPSSIRTIGDGAFGYCPNLKQVVYNGTRDQLAQIQVNKRNNNLLLATWQFGSLGMIDIFIDSVVMSNIMSIVINGGVVLACVIIYFRQKKYPYL